MLETISGSNHYTIKQIFKDFWPSFQAAHPNSIRPVVIDSVNNILACGDPDKLGFHRYACPDCLHSIIVPHTCKSRFCNSCGKVMTDNWIDSASKHFLNVPYHHIVFSPPDSLWWLFAANRSCLHFLFKAAADAILSWCADNANFTPGIVAVLHTFGAQLNFHPHIHVLVTEGGATGSISPSNSDPLNWHDCRFFPHQALKARFRYNLILSLRLYAKAGNLLIPNSVKKSWSLASGVHSFFALSKKLYQVIWYVHIGEKLDNADFTTRYIGRYAKRPAISETSIIGYDPVAQTVSFRFKDKIEKIVKVSTVPVLTFIGNLVRHIPDKGFRMIRYYGIYATAVRGKLLTVLRTLTTALASALIFNPKPSSWQERLTLASGQDPLVCPHCQVALVLTEVVCRTRDGTLVSRSF